MVGATPTSAATLKGINSVLSDRQALWAFALGYVAVTAGVLLHLPMFLMGRETHFRLAGMGLIIAELRALEELERRDGG